MERRHRQEEQYAHAGISVPAWANQLAQEIRLRKLHELEANHAVVFRRGGAVMRGGRFDCLVERE